MSRSYRFNPDADRASAFADKRDRFEQRKAARSRKSAAHDDDAPHGWAMAGGPTDDDGRARRW